MAFKNGYKAVLFDLDGTLRHTVPLAADVFNERVAALGMTLDEDTIREVARWEHYYWANSDELHSDTAEFSGNEDGFWQNYTRRRLHALGADPAQIEEWILPIRKYMRENYKSGHWVPPEVYEILPALRAANLKLGVLSNRRSVFVDLMRELKLSDYFDVIKAAGEIGYWKPDPRIFAPLLESCELTPDEAVYIGDNYYADIVGARAAGIKAILYDPRGIFPEPDCTRITSFHELLEFL